MTVRLLLMILSLSVSALAQMPPIEPGVSQELAKWRAVRYSNVRYKLNLTLEKMSPVLKGTMEIRVSVGAGTLLSPSAQSAETPAIILDWRKIKGHEDKSTISNVTVNGKRAVFPPGTADGDKSVPAPIDEHLVFTDGVVVGENVIKLDFTSPILPSGSAITRYLDKEDGSEYLYSLFVPSDASTAFPVFDQPDLKARFTLSVETPGEWNVITNTNYFQVFNLLSDGAEMFSQRREPIRKTPMSRSFQFSETKPISTYVFAFAAGPWEKVEDTGGNASVNERAGRSVDASTAERPTGTLPNGRVSARDAIYVRQSQAAKFKPHAAEVFRLNREAVKYFEEYFDYKFPFPKYDLVLIPEFPFGGMEHAGATFLRESSIIFPQEPTRNDHVSRATLIFHEAAHQWFGDTVTMRWFDDLWLKEGFATFTAYKAMERIMPEMNAWKVFYERVKQAAYQTDSTKGTTPIYQEIKNLSAAKSAYGNIVYNKAPAFLRQAEFYLGEDKFQSAVRSFLKKHEFGNAGWEDLVREFENVKVADTKSGEFYQQLSDADRAELERFTRWSISKEWAEFWVQKRGTAVYRPSKELYENHLGLEWALKFGETGGHTMFYRAFSQTGALSDGNYNWLQNVTVIRVYDTGDREEGTAYIGARRYARLPDQDAKPRKEYKFPEETEEIRKAREAEEEKRKGRSPLFVFPNYRDYGYGVFLLDEKSREFVLKNIQNEKDPFLRSMMWGALWDSVREGELDPLVYVELAIKSLPTEYDESITSSVLGRVSTAVNYYLSDAGKVAVTHRLEDLITREINKGSSDVGRRLTYYRSFLNIGVSIRSREVYKALLKGTKPIPIGGGLVLGTNELPLRAKDKFDIVTRLLILNDAEAPRLLAELEKTETSDDAKRYGYAARAGIGTAENKAKYWNDFVDNKEISESWIEAAFGPWNSIRHSELTLGYLERALKELPNHKRNRKIFFVNGWLGAFIGGQRSEEALAVVNKFLADNPGLDNDLRLKILENVDVIERAVKIRTKFR